MNKKIILAIIIIVITIGIVLFLYLPNRPLTVAKACIESDGKWMWNSCSAEQTNCDYVPVPQGGFCPASDWPLELNDKNGNCNCNNQLGLCYSTTLQKCVSITE